MVYPISDRDKQNFFHVISYHKNTILKKKLGLKLEFWHANKDQIKYTINKLLPKYFILVDKLKEILQ